MKQRHSRKIYAHFAKYYQGNPNKRKYGPGHLCLSRRSYEIYKIISFNNSEGRHFRNKMAQLELVALDTPTDLSLRK